MPTRAFCCNDTPPKGLVLGIGSVAVLLGLLVVALGSGVAPAVVAWIAAPKWLIVGAGVTIALCGILVPVLTRPVIRRDRASQH